MTIREHLGASAAYFAYDAAGRAGKVDNRKSDMSGIGSFEYVRDANGNPLSTAREDDAAVYYEYDAANELTQETTGGETTYYEYDGSDSPCGEPATWPN